MNVSCNFLTIFVISLHLSSVLRYIIQLFGMLCIVAVVFCLFTYMWLDIADDNYWFSKDSIPRDYNALKHVPYRNGLIPIFTQ